MEDELYGFAKEHTTLITITHRPTLWKHHSHLLQFDGRGSYTLELLNIDTRLSLAVEKAQLKKQLAALPALTERYKQLCDALGDE